MPIKLAYADPPYVGCSKYYDHPDSIKWDSPHAHVTLMELLDQDYDGWALSASAPSLRDLWHESPAGTRAAVWVKPFAAYKKNVRIAYTWEPVLFKPGRDRSSEGAPVGRDHLAESITLKRGLVGAKSERFCRWVLDLLGYVQGDDLEDLFPGTGVMGRTLAQNQLVLYTPQAP
jgi:hypothetical protein